MHRLVLAAFIGPCPEGMEACHFPDSDPNNNNLGNLRWDTRKENIHDSIKHGTFMNGKINGSKLTDQQAMEIIERSKLGSLVKELAAEFMVSRKTIRRIKRGETFRHIQQ